MDTNPWHSQHWLAKWFRALPQTSTEVLAKLGLTHWSQYGRLYEQPGGRSQQAENIENLRPGYYERMCIGKDAEWIRVYVDGEDASAAPGSVYGRLIEALRNRRGVGAFDHPADGVFTTWDLGYSDSTAIWFWRVNEHRAPDLIDHYESHGREMGHYFDVVDAKGYGYVKHWFPHDALAKSLQTGLTLLEQSAKRWPGKVAIVPRNDVEDGIAAARWLLEQPMRVHARCTEALETLAAYRYDWDEESQTFGVKPVHDFASHTADAFRYLACVVKHSERWPLHGPCSIPSASAARKLRLNLRRRWIPTASPSTESWPSPSGSMPEQGRPSRAMPGRRTSTSSIPISGGPLPHWC
jgi:hypothetical protein